MPKLERHVGRVSEDGRTLILRSLPAWRLNLGRLKAREVEVTIRPRSKPTSHDTHGYYRSTVLPLLAEEWGWADPDELHERLKEKHLRGIVPAEDPRWRLVRIGADSELLPPSMGDLTQEESSEYLDAVIRHAQEDGINVPPPRGSDGRGRV